jgi:hypothetical protein
MSNSIKRVSLDFEWTIGMPWKGFVNEFEDMSTDCHKCNGSGHSPQAQHLHDQWLGSASFRPEQRGSVPLKPADPHVWARAKENVERNPKFCGQGEAAIQREAERLCSLWNASWSHHLNADDVEALLAHDRLWDLTRTWVNGAWILRDPAPTITPEMVNAFSITGTGHDLCNAVICIRAECARLAVAYDCPICSGKGQVYPSTQVAAAAKAWKREEPPVGAGLQLWSDDAPVSPVFPGQVELVRWIVAQPEDFRLVDKQSALAAVAVSLMTEVTPG